jgi:hypothetical protein
MSGHDLELSVGPFEGSATVPAPGRRPGPGPIGWNAGCSCGWWAPEERHSEAEAIREHDAHVLATGADR